MGNRLCHKIVPKIAALTPKVAQKTWGWLQDGAPCHWALSVNHFLHEKFGENVIARDFNKRFGVGLDWPAGSCDFNALDISINYDIKQSIWAKNPPKTIAQLRSRAVEELDSYSQEKIDKVLSTLSKRARQCVNARGFPFEYLN